MLELLQKQKDALSEREQALARERALQTSLKSQKDQLAMTLHSTNNELCALREERDRYDRSRTILFRPGYGQSDYEGMIFQFRMRILQLDDEVECSRVKLGCYFYAMIIALVIITYLLISKIKSDKLIANAEIVLNDFKDRCPSDVRRYRVERMVFLGVIGLQVVVFFLSIFSKIKERYEEEHSRTSRY